MPPGCWETWRGRRAISAVRPAKARQRLEPSFVLGVGQALQLVADLARVPAVRQARQPFQLAEGQPERLADVSDRAARAVGREAGHQRRVLFSVALDDAHDQLLADVAREVEVDVGHAGHLAIEEAPERELGGDRIDVREPGQVADDRADRAAAPAPGRQHAARRAGPAHLGGDLARQLEHLVVQAEKSRQPELLDQPQLLVEAGARLRRKARGRADNAPQKACSQISARRRIAGSPSSEKSG